MLLFSGPLARWEQSTWRASLSDSFSDSLSLFSPITQERVYVSPAKSLPTISHLFKRASRYYPGRTLESGRPNLKPTLPFTVCNLGQLALSSLSLVFLNERRMMNFTSQGKTCMLKVCVTRCILGLFILPQNWQLEPNTVTKESISKSCHQQLRPVIFLRTYYKAAKQTLLSASPETPPTFLPSFIYNKQRKIKSWGEC